jgi:hypothetical protein
MHNYQAISGVPPLNQLLAKFLRSAPDPAARPSSRGLWGFDPFASHLNPLFDPLISS